MLSHLRFHRRGGPTTNPPGPDYDSQYSSDHDRYNDHIPLLATPLSNSVASASSRGPPLLNNFDTTTPSQRDGAGSSVRSSLPPMLPPIARVASPDGDRESIERKRSDAAGLVTQKENWPSPSTQQRSQPSNMMESGFIGGVALENYRRGLKAQADSRHDSAPYQAPSTTERRRPMPAPIDTNVQPGAYVSGQPVFVGGHSLHSNPASTATGRRGPNMRLPADYSTLPPNPVNLEPQKTKKSLPFLKNPMSTLLMRRKNSQHAPDFLPQPMSGDSDEPMYDPRIRGTRVHDFSAPRRPPVQSKPPQNGQVRNDAQQPTVLPEQSNSQPAIPLPHQPQRAASSAVARPSSTHGRIPSPAGSQKPKASRMSDGSIVSPLRAVNSTSTTRSGNPSLASDMSSRDRLSMLPRHMKSTSSRFSFDMIGAANAEKLLEERHRQREAERRIAQEAQPQPRDSHDSRYDDFDDDSFDYDAMMDDDGLEERIPGVNADYEEEDYYLEEDVDLDDPDNDQENFAGFSFQRSADSSLMPTPNPAMATTPRDEEGNVIGFAASRDIPQALFSEDGENQLDPNLLSPPAGLGIQSPGDPPLSGFGSDDLAQVLAAEAKRKLELDQYFNEGAVGFEDEFAEDLASILEEDDAPFDESIFDRNDTDQYGRPIAGAFAKAQAEAQAEMQSQTPQQEEEGHPPERHGSDMSSRYSGQSGISRSTAHTSLSTDAARQRKTEKEETAQPGPETAPNSFAQDQGSMEAYQAALAAAAHKAAASGKFQWGAAPRDEDGEQDEADGFSGHGGSPIAESVGSNDEYGFSSYENMDDFDLDDDAIIAEANASALANDSDGWYGQEFGFYSAPSNQHYGSSSSNGMQYEYANGGFFGPKGMSGVDRSMSGRVVSREPNLTPITERSEYSNRNSVMSMAIPGHGFATPGQSPGLAQLAMMVDRGDDMSLSALLRLRSKAWGGSQVSLASSKDGSPKSERGDLPFSSWAGNSGGYAGANGWHARKNSVVSATAPESEPGSISGSPTITMSLPNLTPTAMEPPPSQLGTRESRLSAMSEPSKHQETSALSNNKRVSLSAFSGMNAADWTRGQEPTSPSIPTPRPGHQHRHSTDSVSYIKEEDSGETRWVLERRRTGDSGQEVLEREVVDGGRI